MLVSPLKKFLGLGAVLGAGGLGLFGANETSKKTIQDALGDRKIVKEEIKNTSENLGAWKRLVMKLADVLSSDNSKVKSPEFKILKNSINDPKSKEQLKEVCEKSIDLKYSDLFTKNKDLMEDVENFCFLSMKDMLFGRGTFNISGNSYSREERNDLESNITVNMDSLNQDGIKKPELIEIKNKFSSRGGSSGGEESIQLLFNFCKKEYSSPYLGDESISLKDLISKYCVKSERSSYILR